LVAAAFLAALAASSASSCVRKSDASVRQPAKAPAGEAAAPASAGARSGAARGRSAPAAAAPKSVPPLAAGIRAFGLGARPTPRMPEDFSLGPLQSLQPASKQEAAALATARSFLDGIAAGKIDASLFLPEARDALSALLSPAPLKEGESLSPARLGALGIEGDSASLRVRLPAPEGAARTEGVISLRERDGTWYVEALAIDPSSQADLAFDPGARSPAP